MPIGTALLAAGKQRSWTLVQLLCVVNSVVLDPLLIRYFQDHYGNGGTGLPVAATISEAMMVIAGMVLMPKGVFDRALAKQLALALLSGATMTAAAYALRGVTSWVAAPLAGLAYVGALTLMGALSREQLGALQGIIQRRLRRKR
jgi:Na+-driven multidrug efflux pump